MKLHPRAIFGRDPDEPIISDMTLGEYVLVLFAIGLIAATVMLVVIYGALVLLAALP